MQKAIIYSIAVPVAGVLSTCLAAPALATLVPGAAPAAASVQAADRSPRPTSVEARITRVTTRYRDAYAMTSRTAGGDLETVLFSPAGEQLVSLSLIARKGRVSLSGFGADDDATTFNLVGSSRSADWANAQLYSAWRDAQTEALEKSLGLVRWQWQGDYLRLTSSVFGEARSEGDRGLFLSRQAIAVATRFGDLEAVSVRHPEPSSPSAPAAADRDSVAFSTRLVDQRSGRVLARARWFDQRRIFAWDLSAAGGGSFSEELSRRGNSLRPDMAWANLRTFALYQAQGPHDERGASGGPVIPDGVDCDGLPGLDGGISASLPRDQLGLCDGLPRGRRPRPGRPTRTSVDDR